MATKLEKPLRREVQIGEQPYMLTISPEGLKLVPKGKRKGYALEWEAFVSGEAALATALNASIAAAPEPQAPTQAATKKKAKRGKPRSRPA